MKRGTRISSPVSSVAAFVTPPLAVSPRTPGSVATMKKLEPELSGDLHVKVTNVLVELTAYNVMRLLHELQRARARMAFGKA